MALAISSVLVVLVGTVFLVQNRFYANQLKRESVHDDARTVTQVMGDALRSVMADGITQAQNRQITIRSPIVLAAVCAIAGGSVEVYVDGGVAELDTAEVAGFALRNDTTGAWSYYNATWRNLRQSGGHPAGDCAANGADTTGAAGSFLKLRHIHRYAGSLPAVSDVVMLFRQTEFKIQRSVLDTTTEGLFRAAYGDTLIEYVTGLDTTAQFEYRTGGTTYATSVASGDLGSIDAVRVVAQARERPETGTEGDITFGWSVDFLLPNVR